MKFTNLSVLSFYQVSMHPKRSYIPVEVERTMLITESNKEEK
jgi:hypothetical protein